MAGSNMVEVPAALIELLTAEFADETEVKVTYTEAARDQAREHFYGGRVEGPQETLAMRGGGRRPREENLTWQLYLWVARPDMQPLENARRARELALRAEERLAAADVQSGAGVPGCVQIGVSAVAMEHARTDDESITEIALTISFKSVLK